MFISGIVDTKKSGFTIREIIGETEYTKFIANLHGIKYEIIGKGKKDKR